jgi:hypothetical protein
MASAISSSLREKIAHDAQHITARRCWSGPPLLEAFLRARNSPVHVGHSRERKLADEIVPVGRVQVLEIFAGVRRGPRTSDEVVELFHEFRFAL